MDKKCNDRLETNNYLSMKKKGVGDHEIIDIQMMKLCMICNIQLCEFQEKKHDFKNNYPSIDQLSQRARRGKNKSKKESMFKPIYINYNQPVIHNKQNSLIKADGQRKIDHSFKVRRHIRNQPYGEGRKDIKQIWIEEHIRGSGKLIEKTEKVIF